MTRATTPRVMGALMTAGEDWASPAWIVEQTGLRSDQVNSALERLVRDGRALKAGSRNSRSYRLARPNDSATAAEQSVATVQPDSSPTFDVAIWTSGSIVIEKDGLQLALDSAEADRLMTILRAAESMRDEFVEIDRAAAAALSEDAEA